MVAQEGSLRWKINLVSLEILLLRVAFFLFFFAIFKIHPIFYDICYFLEILHILILGIYFFLSICAVFKICPFHYYFIFSCQECNLFGNAFPVSINRMILRFLVKSFSIKRKIVQGCCAQTFSNCSSPLNSDFGSKFWSNVSKIQSKSDFPEAVVSTRVTANRPWGNSLECLWLHLPLQLFRLHSNRGQIFRSLISESL